MKYAGPPKTFCGCCQNWDSRTLLWRMSTTWALTRFAGHPDLLGAWERRAGRASPVDQLMFVLYKSIKDLQYLAITSTQPNSVSTMFQIQPCESSWHLYLCSIRVPRSIPEEFSHGANGQGVLAFVVFFAGSAKDCDKHIMNPAFKTVETLLWYWITGSIMIYL